MQTSIMNINDNYVVAIKNTGNGLKQPSSFNTLQVVGKKEASITCLLVSYIGEGSKEVGSWETVRRERVMGVWGVAFYFVNVLQV